tara:strand:+ start:3012 stop:3383 length:372 start_codon:yes stop_codon:yes gene_type:complete
MSGRGKLPNGLIRILTKGRLFGKKAQSQVNSNFEECLLTRNLTVSAPLNIDSSKFGHVNISLGILDDDGKDFGWCAKMPDLEGVLICDSEGGGTVEIPAMDLQIGLCGSAHEDDSGGHEDDEF